MNELQNNIKNVGKSVAKKQRMREYIMKKWKIAGIIGAVTAVILIGIGIYNSPSQRVERQLSLGYKYLENQQYEEAIVVFSNAIAIDPKCLEAYAGGIEAYINTDKTEEMQFLYDNALSVVRSLEPNVLAQNESTVNRIYLNADEVYEDNIEKVTKILEEGLDITENSEEIKIKLDDLNAQKVNIVFMQKVYDLMEAENYEALRELADSEEADRILTGIQEDSYIYIPKDSMRLNGLGAGIYKYDTDDYYFFYGNYVDGVRSGQGTSFMIFKEDENKSYPGIVGEYRIFTGEWQKDVPNGLGREELVNAFAVNDIWIGNVVSEGNLKEGLWEGDVQCTFTCYTSVLDKKDEFDCSFSASMGVPLMKYEGYEGYVFVYDGILSASGTYTDRWVECIIVEGNTIGTSGYGDVYVDETILWIFGQ